MAIGHLNTTDRHISRVCDLLTEHAQTIADT
jgi:hypothetical protein